MGRPARPDWQSARRGCAAKLADIDMKPLGPIRPEPSPPQAGLWTVVLALGLMLAGVAFALYGFYDAGAIGGRAFLAIMALAVALSAALAAAMDAGPQPPGDAPPRSAPRPRRAHLDRCRRRSH